MSDKDKRSQTVIQQRIAAGIKELQEAVFREQARNPNLYGTFSYEITFQNGAVYMHHIKTNQTIRES